MLLQYTIGHAVQWDAWLDLVDRHRPSAPVQRALLAAASQFFFAYADRLTQFTIDEYTAERERLLQGHEQRRVHLVREVLDGRDVDSDALGYGLDGYHVGVVASSGTAQTLRHVAHALDRRLLLVRVGQDRWWGWLGGDRALSPERADALRRLSAPAQETLGFGDEAFGADGFRRSHRQALIAHAAPRRGQPSGVTHYDEIALEALGASDPQAATEFINRELRGLQDDSVRSRRLRQTLGAYFAAGQNAAAAAAALGIHEQTVTHRLRAVEERVGRPVATRRAELETALRLFEHLQRAAPPER